MNKTCHIVQYVGLKKKSYIKWEEKNVMVKSKLFVETVVIVAIMRYENENI